MTFPKLYDWQSEAIDSFKKNDYKGIVLAVTGTGKTLVALKLLHEMRQRTLIVVPTIALLDQWKKELLKIGVKEKDLGVYYGEVKLWNNITIAVVNSIHDETNLEDKFSFLILDEIHRYGAENWQKFLLNNRFKYSLGLTATLERNDGNHDVLIQRVGDVVYEYDTSDAIRDGMLNTFTIVNKGIDLPMKEEEYLKRLDYEIKDNMSSFKNNFTNVINAVKKGNRKAGKTLQLVNKRKKFYNNSIPKIEQATNFIEYLLKFSMAPNRNPNSIPNKYITYYNILYNIYNKENNDNHNIKETVMTIDDYNKEDANSNNKGVLIRNPIVKPKIIVFGEYIETADLLHQELKRRGINSWVYYSGNNKSKFKLNRKEKKEVIESFKEAETGILITVKALDEGLNVKDANIGILLGYNKTDRQAIQRMGRILRKVEGKHPIMMNFYYRNTSDQLNAKNFAENFNEAGKTLWK